MSTSSSPAAGAVPEKPVTGVQPLHAALERAVGMAIAAGTYKVPLLPQVANQVIALVADANVDAARLSALIHRDPSLAGQILRTANSAAYSPRMPIVSLQQAVARLGLNLIAEIAFAASIQSGIFKVPGHEATLKHLWRHALAAGVWAKDIARLRRANVESAFLCGLLHAVGKPALLQLTIDRAAELHFSPEVTWLRAHIEAQHQGLGRKVAEVWKLPSPVSAAIAFYNDYGQAGAHVHAAQITCLAQRMATWMVEPETYDDVGLRQHQVFADLNLYPEDVNTLCARRPAVAAAVDALMVA